MKATDIEIAVVNYFDCRRCLIVPNISWAMFRYEMDLIVVRPSGYATEIEIKISISDLRADQKKWHGHRNDRIKNLYFAIPKTLLAKALPLIPEEAGILTVEAYDDGTVSVRCEVERQAKDRNKYKFNDREMLTIAKNAAIKLWSAKHKIRELKQKGGQSENQ